MDNEKKASGAPQAYTRESQRYIQELELRRRQQEQKVKEESPGPDSPERAGKKPAGSSIRRREQENTQKIQILCVVLGVLTVMLIAALIYEVALGHGAVTTGNERMAQQEQEEALNIAYGEYFS